MAGVMSAGGTAASAAISGVDDRRQDRIGAELARNKDHAWFVGFAPRENPKIVVAVILEFGVHGYFAARVASKIIEHYLKAADVDAGGLEGE